MRSLHHPLLITLLFTAAACRTSEPDKPAQVEATKAVQVMPAVPLVRNANHSEQPAQPVGSHATRAERAESLQTRFAAAQESYYAEFRKRLEGKDTENMTQADWEAIQKDLPAIPMDQLTAEAKQILAENDGDDAALSVIAWMLGNGASDSKACEAILVAKHMQSDKLESLLTPFSPLSEEFVREVIAQTKSKSVRASAQMALAGKLKENLETAERLKGAPEEERAQYEGWLGKERLEAIAKLDVEAARKEVLTLLETLERDADPKSVAGQAAAGELFELRNLSLGMPSPEIEGHDLDGVAFKLSDYRGKVILLDFWGNW
jgi:hypothetical protein